VGVRIVAQCCGHVPVDQALSSELPRRAYLAALPPSLEVAICLLTQCFHMRLCSIFQQAPRPGPNK
jgi:hypothetical protein